MERSGAQRDHNSTTTSHKLLTLVDSSARHPRSTFESLHTMNHDRLTPCCPVCETFVTGLIKVFRTRTVVLRPTRITWGFEDKEPQLKRLAESSTQCQWCSILDYAWDRRRSAGRRTGKIKVTFTFVTNQQEQGLLGDIVTLSPELSNHRATFHPTNMSLHVMRNNSIDFPFR